MATTRIQIGPTDHGRPMTLDAFLEADEEPGHQYELARGVLEVTRVPNDPHWQVVSNLQDFFYQYRRENPGLILRIGGGGECQVLIPELVSGRNPDLAVVFRGTPKDSRGRQPPSLVAEVVSRRGEVRDYQTKREEYLVFGLLEYWIIDPQRRQVIVLDRQDEGPVPTWSERIFEGNEAILSRLFPGFAARVADLWADLELDDEEPEA